MYTFMNKEVVLWLTRTCQVCLEFFIGSKRSSDYRHKQQKRQEGMLYSITRRFSPYRSCKSIFEVAWKKKPRDN